MMVGRIVARPVFSGKELPGEDQKIADKVKRGKGKNRSWCQSHCPHHPYLVRPHLKA